MVAGNYRQRTVEVSSMMSRKPSSAMFAPSMVIVPESSPNVSLVVV